MAKFVLIDHSLKGIGGHNYEYAVHILRTAEQRGFRPVLAAWRGFRDGRRLPDDWTLHTPYRHTTYQSDRVVRKLDALATVDTDEAPMLSRTWHRFRRRGLDRKLDRFTDRFARATANLFEREGIEPGDQVFVPTISPTDLAGLVRFFRSTPEASQVHWHLQFHFKIYAGMEPDYPQQDERLDGVRQIFRDCLAAMPAEKLHFYTTTDQVTRQYNRLGMVPFQTLPYPVDPAFHLAAGDRRERRTLRATCLGGLRQEKGPSNLPLVLQRLWDDYFETGRLQLVVQSRSAAKLPAALRELVEQEQSTTGLRARREARVPSNSTSSVDGRGGPSYSKKIDMVGWPLSTEEYRQTILDSDIGLLLYDREQYYIRCSGVMVEMLAAGIPVIATAGCWMADQLADPIYRHREHLRRTLPEVESADVLDGDELAVPDGASHLFVSFRRIEPTGPGVYVDVRIDQRDAAGTALGSSHEVLGGRPDGQPTPVLVPVRPGTRSIRLQTANAYGDVPVVVRQDDIAFLSADASCPQGAVGLIAADAEQVPELLRDMIDHYDHYRATAGEFSKQWGPWHSPQQVTTILLEQSAWQCGQVTPAA